MTVLRPRRPRCTTSILPVSSSSLIASALRTELSPAPDATSLRRPSKRSPLAEFFRPSSKRLASSWRFVRAMMTPLSVDSLNPLPELMLSREGGMESIPNSCLYLLDEVNDSNSQRLGTRCRSSKPRNNKRDFLFEAVTFKTGSAPFQMVGNLKTSVGRQ
jgi:hypothetical protein